MSNDRYKLKAISKELAKEFGLELRYNNKDNAYDLGTSQGQNRDPETAKDRKQIIAEAWQQYTDPKQFDIALRQHGYIIAQGDRRAFVIVDRDNQIHSLARQIDGVKTKEVKLKVLGSFGGFALHVEWFFLATPQGLYRKERFFHRFQTAFWLFWF